jgi:hypothetical protein
MSINTDRTVRSSSQERKSFVGSSANSEPVRSTAVPQQVTAVICAHCHQVNKSGEKFPHCSQCKLVYYCSKECQKTAWKIHKHLCALFKLGSPPNDQAQPPRSSTSPFSRPTASFPDKNVIPLIGTYGDPTIQRLKQEGYKGLSSQPPELLDAAVSNQHYVELLKYIWTEDNLETRIHWLRPNVEKGHPILMLELSRACLLKIQRTQQYSEEIVDEAFKWRVLGVHTAFLDAWCTKRRVGFSVVKWLQMTSLMFAKKVIDELPSAVRKPLSEKLLSADFLSSQQRRWHPSEMHHSPEWIVYSCQEALQAGQNPLTLLEPEERWLEIQQKAHQELMEGAKTNA